MFAELTRQFGLKLLNYVKDSFQNDPFRILLELILFFIALKYLLSREVSRKKDVLSEKEISSLIEEWSPSDAEEIAIPVEEIHDDKYIYDLRDSKFLEHPDNLKGDLQDIVGKYGVGTCGPRGFYGTIDLHQVLEEKVANYFNLEAAVIYSQAFSAVSSTIPAFVKRDDIVFVDELANAAIQTGLKISRGTIYFFSHNDLVDLEAKLNEVERILTEKKISPPRKFIVVESLYFNTGTICPLDEIIKLKKKFKCRIILDESYSLGSISFRGGLAKQFGLSNDCIDIILGSFTNSVGSAGGFSGGNTHVSDHQRLSSQAYCFSASMPALLTKYSIDILSSLNEDNQSVKALKRTIDEFYRNLTITSPFKIISSQKSPIVAISTISGTKIFSLYKMLLAKGLGVNLINLNDQKIIQFFLTSKLEGVIIKIKKILEDSMQSV